MARDFNRADQRSDLWNQTATQTSNTEVTHRSYALQSAAQIRAGHASISVACSHNHVSRVTDSGGSDRSERLDLKHRVDVGDDIELDVASVSIGQSIGRTIQ
jgi:hypothetical protein